MNNSFTIRNCQVVLEDRVLADASVRVVEGEIAEIATEIKSDDEVNLDAQGAFLAPGFVDVHCHGDGTTRYFDDPDTVSRNLLHQGTTTVLATLGYPDMKPDALAEQLRRFQDQVGEHTDKILGGIHMEGPYVNKKYGAQTSRGVIKNPDPREYAALLAEFAGIIKWWTCAPELPGALEFIRDATKQGGVVGAGHTEATIEELSSAISAGLQVITHWTNATGNAHAIAFKGTRYPGIDEAALVFDELSAEIIPDKDGLHVHPLMMRLLLKAKGPNRILIITDAGYARHDDPPESGERRDVSIDSEGNLAGSRLSMAEAARNFRKFTQCGWPELFRMAALNAARILKMDDRIGSLAVGKKANMILFDDDLKVQRIFLRGIEC